MAIGSTSALPLSSSAMGSMIRGCSAHVPRFENKREALTSKPLKEWEESVTWGLKTVSVVLSREPEVKVSGMRSYRVSRIGESLIVPSGDRRLLSHAPNDPKY